MNHECVLMLAHVPASLKRQHTDVLLNFIAAITVGVIVSVGESGYHPRSFVSEWEHIYLISENKNKIARNRCTK